jgi:hypothetical protein
MSFFVCFLYSFKAAKKIVSKFVEEVEVDGTCDIVSWKEPSWMRREEQDGRNEGEGQKSLQGQRKEAALGDHSRSQLMEQLVHRAPAASMNHL